MQVVLNVAGNRQQQGDLIAEPAVPSLMFQRFCFGVLIMEESYSPGLPVADRWCFLRHPDRFEHVVLIDVFIIAEVPNAVA